MREKRCRPLRLGITGAAKIDPGQREKRQSTHDEVKERACADLVDPFVGERHHEVEEALAQEDQHQEVKPLGDVAEPRDEPLEAERAHARSHVLQSDQHDACAEAQ